LEIEENQKKMERKKIGSQVIFEGNEE